MSNLSFNPNIAPSQPQTPLPGQPAVPTNPRQVAGLPPQFMPGVPTAKGRAEAMGAPQIFGMSLFDDLAGVKPEDHAKGKQKSLRARKQTTVQQRSRNAQRKVMNRINLNPEDDDEPIRDEATKTIFSLRAKGRRSLEQDLEQEYDPLQRYALLHNALAELDDRDMPASEKEELKEQLNGMLSDLMAKHRSEIRKGLKDQQEVAAAMQAMAGNNASLRELRFLYGAKGTGVFDSPLSALAMAKALHERFGADNFNSGMSSLRSRMSSEFRVNPEQGMNSRFWLCMTDAAAFNAVQSTHAIAGELRHDLIAKANVMPRASDAAVTVALLGVVDAGKVKLSSLVNQIHDGKDDDPVTKGRVYEQILLAFRKLPVTLWPLDKMPQRLDVIDDLSKQIGVAYRGMPTLETGVERRERQWREAWTQKEQQTPDDNEGKPALPPAT